MLIFTEKRLCTSLNAKQKHPFQILHLLQSPGKLDRFGNLISFLHSNHRHTYIVEGLDRASAKAQELHLTCLLNTALLLNTRSIMRMLQKQGCRDATLSASLCEDSPSSSASQFGIGCHLKEYAVFVEKQSLRRVKFFHLSTVENHHPATNIQLAQSNTET